MTHLVLGYPGPVADRLVALLAERGEQVVVIAPGVDPASLPAGVTLLVAEPTNIDFGLSGTEYGQLLQQVTRITLCALAPRAVKDVEESPLVRLASEVMEFVRAGGAPQGVVLLSSLLVFGNARGSVTEEDFYVGQKFESRDEEAMAVAEKIVRTLDGSANVAILRTAPIVGDEQSGELLEYSALARLARRIEASNDELSYTFNDLPVWIETVDRAARALLALTPENGLRAYHLVDEEPLTDRSLLDFLATRSQRTIVENVAAPGVLSSFLRAGSGQHRVVQGWGLHFARKNAEHGLKPLLDREPLEVLEALFGTPEESGDLA